MCHELDQSIVQLPVTALRDNPRNSCVHADFDPQGRDAWLIDDIRQHGILMPLLVFPNGVINEGHRRRNVAKYLKLQTVPVIELQPTDPTAAFSSAQLHRQMSLFAKCVLYRDRISELIQRSEAASRNLPTDHKPDVGDCNQVNQAWTQCEEVLGVSRRYLLRGVKLLAALEELSNTGSIEDKHRGARVLSVFRNRGLKPALRLFGESDGDADDAEGEPDVIQWHTDDGEPDATDPKRRPGRPKKIAGSIGPEGVKPGRPHGSWRGDALGQIAQVRRTLQKHKAYNETAQEAIAVLEGVVTNFVAEKRARAA